MVGAVVADRPQRGGEAQEAPLSASPGHRPHGLHSGGPGGGSVSSTLCLHQHQGRQALGVLKHSLPAGPPRPPTVTAETRPSAWRKRLHQCQPEAPRVPEPQTWLPAARPIRRPTQS